jgi:hypothetical protein
MVVGFSLYLKRGVGVVWKVCCMLKISKRVTFSYIRVEGGLITLSYNIMGYTIGRKVMEDTKDDGRYV